MTYHLFLFKSRVVLHVDNAGNSSVWSTVRKPCREGLIGIVIYLD